MLEFVDYRSYMSLAMELAEKGKGFTLTNPLVGCVIVNDDRIIGRGYHKKFGDLHAETMAIEDAKKNGESLEGSTLYVNLEPCCHYGKQPPCTKAIIENKIKKVVIANVDPNKKVSGKGIKTLEDAGIEVVEGIMEEEGLKLNEEFFHFIKTQRPFVTMKSAMTLDGKIASVTGDSKWISSQISRDYVHKLRAENNAIMVGIGTVLKDDPSLNVRIYGNYKNPTKIIVDSKLRIPIDAKLLSSSDAPTIIACTEGYDTEKYNKLKEMANVHILVCKKKDERVDLLDLFSKLKDFDICSVLLEGGGNLNYSMLRENLVDRLIYFIGPKIIGGSGLSPVAGEGITLLKDAIKLKDFQVEKMGQDILINAYVDKEE